LITLLETPKKKMTREHLIKTVVQVGPNLEMMAAFRISGGGPGNLVLLNLVR
jgi:hypothetical protein